MTNFVEKIFMWKKGVVMNSVTKSNYQMTFGMKEILKPAAIIQHKAKQTYQHISPHVLQTKYGKNQYFTRKGVQPHSGRRSGGKAVFRRERIGGKRD